MATIVARRPTTSPEASTISHFFSMSAAFADLVVFMTNPWGRGAQGPRAEVAGF
jgi:hypothetical protein